MEYGVGVLKDALSRDYITWNEYEERLDQLISVETLADLRALLGELPSPSPGRPVSSVSRRRTWFVAASVLVAMVAAASGIAFASSFSVHSPHRSADSVGSMSATSEAANSTGTQASTSDTSNADLTTPVAATCVRSVPFEQTEPMSLNRVYRFLPPADPASCVSLAGLHFATVPCGCQFDHVHIDLNLMGGLSPIAKGIGVNPSDGQVSGLVTQSDSGIVWFLRGRQYTLGQLFQEWGQPLTDTEIGTLRINPSYPLTWYVNGAAVSNPAAVVLHNHDEIWAFEDEAGAPVSPVSSFAWPPGY